MIVNSDTKRTKNPLLLHCRYVCALDIILTEHDSHITTTSYLQLSFFFSFKIHIALSPTVKLTFFLDFSYYKLRLFFSCKPLDQPNILEFSLHQLKECKKMPKFTLYHTNYRWNSHYSNTPHIWTQFRALRKSGKHEKNN